jgi:1-carboxybiuret hydrolase
LFSSSLDHVGPFARSVRDLALIYDLLQGYDPHDPVCADRAVELSLPNFGKSREGVRIAIADGYFAEGADPEVFAAVEQVAQALGATQRVTIPEPRRARAAAFVITSCEGANLHLEDLRTRPQAFDFATRDRFLAGCLVPSTWYLQAQRFRQWYREQVRQIFQQVDVILAPTTPCVAPLIGQQKMMLNGVEVLLRPNLGLFTQPLSFIGLPIVSIPVQRSGKLPLGVQVIGAPYQEALILQISAELEAKGIASALLPQG